MADISDMDWAQHIKMDYDPNIRKDQMRPSQIFYRIQLAYFTALQNREFAVICSKLPF